MSHIGNTIFWEHNFNTAIQQGLREDEAADHADKALEYYD